MATYIPGVEDQIPQSQPFVPDYKFLSDVLQVRQDRYDKNYKQLNDVYGKVVYADLTREDNKYVRDQYAEQLAPKVKQISGLDLSLQSNVDSAYALFKPFYDDDQVIKDLTATATLKNERKKMNSFKDSPIRAVREKYWDYGQQGLDIWQEDFKNADPQKALTMGLPQYIEDVDLVETAEMILGDSGLDEQEDVYISQDNKWLIKQKSGSLITAAPTGNMVKVKDKKTGKEMMVPETENLALNYIKDRLMDDPKVQAAYHLRNYVDMRNHVKENSEAAGGDDAAKKQWANETIKKYTPVYEEEIANLSKVQENKKLEVSSWETYAKEVGINPGSDDDTNYLNSLSELEIIDKTLMGAKDKLSNATAATEDIKDLLQKAYTLAMANQMGGDMLAAASSYAAKTMVRDKEANPNYTKWVEHQYALQRIAYKSSLEDAKKNMENASDTPEVSLYRRKDGNITNRGGDINVANKTIEGDGADGVSDAIAMNTETVSTEIEINNSEMKEVIKEIYIKNAEALNLDPATFTPIFSPDLMVGVGTMQTGDLIYQGEEEFDENGMLKPRPVSGAVGDGSTIGDITQMQSNFEKDNMNMPERIAYYPKSSAMSWKDFNDIDDKDLIHDMYMNALNMIDNAETKLPSYMLLNQQDRSDIAYKINNLTGIMSDFTSSTDKMAAQYMKVQNYLVSADDDFAMMATDGGSIFDNNGILIPKDQWTQRYIQKWTTKSQQEIAGNMHQGNFPNEQFLPQGSTEIADTIPPMSQMLLNPAVQGENLNLQLNGGKYWQTNMMGTEMPGGYGIQEYNITPPNVRVDQIESDADAYYDYIYTKINQTMTKDDKNAKEFGFNLSADLNNMPSDIGGDLTISPQHEFKYDQNASASTNAESVKFMNNIFEILDGDEATYSIYAGGNLILEQGETLGVHNEEMRQVLDEIYWNMTDNYGKSKDEGGGAPKDVSLSMTVAYSKNKGGDNINAAGYEITLPMDWVNKQTGSYNNTKGDYTTGYITKGNSAKFLKDNTITILVEKELDNNLYKTGDRDQRWIMNELSANDGIINRTIPGGGVIQVYEISNGRYMLNTNVVHYEDGKKQIIQGLNMEIPASQISNVLTTQQEILRQLATSNIDLQKSYNIVNNYIQ